MDLDSADPLAGLYAELAAEPECKARKERVAIAIWNAPKDHQVQKRLVRAQGLIRRCRLDPDRRFLALVLSADARTSRRALRQAGWKRPVPPEADAIVAEALTETPGALADLSVRTPSHDPMRPYARYTVGFGYPDLEIVGMGVRVGPVVADVSVSTVNFAAATVRLDLGLALPLLRWGDGSRELAIVPTLGYRVVGTSAGGTSLLLAVDHAVWVRPHFGMTIGATGGVSMLSTADGTAVAPDVRLKYGFMF